MTKILRGAAFNQGAIPTIAVVNLATTPLGTTTGGAHPLQITTQSLVAALQKAMDQTFGPVWFQGSKSPATLKIFPSIASIPKDAWQFILVDDADQAGALGYHDLTKNGQPVAFIFVRTTIQAGEDVCVTAAHELWEMLIDPGAQLWAQWTAKKLVAYEMSDPTEEDWFLVDGHKISNFVYPSYFEYWHKAGAVQFDYMKKLPRPFSMTKGGYMILMVAGKVSNVFGSKAKAKRFAREDRRGHRSEYRKPIGKSQRLPKRRLRA
jgi:hypothetical protein